MGVILEEANMGTQMQWTVRVLLNELFKEEEQSLEAGKWNMND